MQAAAQPSPSLVHSLQDRLPPVIVIAYQATVIAAMLIILFLGLRWMRQPFLGAFVEHTRVINTVTPVQPDSWALQRYDLPFGYQIVALNDQPVASVQEIQAFLSRQNVGDVVVVATVGPDGARQDFSTELQTFPFADRLTFFYAPYAIAWVYLLASLYVFALRRRDPAGRAFALFTAAAAFCMAGLFDLYTTNVFPYFWTFSVAVCAGALFNLAFVFPKELRLVARYPLLRWLGYAPTLLLTLIAFPTIFSETQPRAYAVAWRYAFVYLALAGIFFVVWAAIRRYRSTSPIEREQARLILWGSGIAFLPLVVWMLSTAVNLSLSFSAVLFLPLAVFPVATGYAIIRYRLLNLDYFLSRGVLYAALMLLAVVGYALLVSGLSLLLGDRLRPTQPLV
ncbi:MAG TPA: hypothetical protein VLS48_07990, partial [Anaerolineales bacterium]|nr:hypothetical protein [Anaerolineales bacterium]